MYPVIVSWSQALQHDHEVRRICATDYLEHVRSLKTRIDALREEIDLNSDMLGTTTRYREKVSKSGNPKSFEDAVIHLQELIADFLTEMAGYVEEQRIAHDVMRRLSRPEYARALTAYYLSGKTWEMCCVDMGYTWQGMMSLRKKAVQEVYDFMPETWRREPIPNAET